MSIDVLASFWFVSFLFVITPGADWAYTISSGLRGHATVVPSVLGLLLGHLIAVLLVASGVGNIVASVPWAMAALTLVGTGYLLWLGINMALHPVAPNKIESQLSVEWAPLISKGVLVSGLNPKVFLLFLALLPQFIDLEASWPVQTQIVAFGGIHIFSCALIYLLIGFGSQKVLQAKESTAQTISRISGIAMVIISLLLLLDQLRSDVVPIHKLLLL